MTATVRCALIGDEPLVAQCADIAVEHGLEVVLIATTNPIVWDAAIAAGIAVVEPGAEMATALDAHPADVLLSIANLRLIPDNVLARVATAINFHDGPLPGYAGLYATTWAILAGEPEHSVTWHLMTGDVDGGDIVATEQFAIADDESAFSLNARCYEAALASFPRIAAGLAKRAVPVGPQPAGERRMFMRHDRPARVFDPAEPAAQSVRAVRALDLGHRVRNSVGSVRLVLGGDVFVIESATVAAEPSGLPAGTLVSCGSDGARIATGDGDIILATVSTATGAPVDIADTLARRGVSAGALLPSRPDLAAAIREVEPQLSRHERFWLDRLAVIEPTILPAAGGTIPTDGAAEAQTVDLDVTSHDEPSVVAAVALWLSRVTSHDTVSFAVTDARQRDILDRTFPLTREPLVRLDVASAATFGDLHHLAASELDIVRGRLPLLADAIGRDPQTRGRDLTAQVIVELELSDRQRSRGTRAIGAGAELHVAVHTDRITVTGPVDRTHAVAGPDSTSVHRLAEQLATVLASGLADPSSPVAGIPLIGPDELALLDQINRTDVEHHRGATIDALFHARVELVPDKPALSFGDRTLSYRELEAEVAVLSGRLSTAGVGRGDRVGIAVPRGIDMLVGVLATLDLGAAYLPLDPTYPVERLEFMVGDAGIRVLLACGSTAAELGRPGISVVDPARSRDSTPHAETAAARGRADHTPSRTSSGDPGDLAYVIYTSGSTGLPKGVMLEHRQVANFFTAMDRVIGTDPTGVWLAVTSLSFDISVLELLWTVTRGFHVVIKSDRGVPAIESGPEASTISSTAAGSRTPSQRAARPVSFSLFYFAAGEDAASDGYRLLLESARFADRNGFEAVWTPERHFHAFGGAYPNPSVAGAALAAITTNVAIRAGSVVLPLHSPIRVAEEWAVVDNLSRGRVGISFAAGWQPNDFVLNPTAFATAKADLPASIELVQRLWRGETVPLPGHDGALVDVRTLPRPVQAELPIWLTSAGSPATFERAGALGTNVLTHLLGQTVEQLSENIERYRSAWRAAGHDGEGRVTLMLHTYLDRDADAAKATAREPMKGYLSTAVGLLRDFATAFPIFAKSGTGADDIFKSLTADEMDQLLEAAADRYLGTSGLFGTPEDAVSIVEAVSGAGVDEVACLVDFGVPTDEVLESLELLREAKSMVDERRTLDQTQSGDDVDNRLAVVDAEADTVAALVARHGVTHLQCTPSLASMLVADPADHAALGQVGHLMLGGEALPSALAAELRDLLPGRLTNMYGPTETTIWSLTHELVGDPGRTIPIGTPIANTTIFVLDAAGRRLPMGAFGELHIGGEGVARGYHNRPDLTGERFVDRPGMGRVYATGDVVRIHRDGYVEFAGRADNQVKIRGHRIELGEIESVLDRHPDVVQSVVVARDDKGDTRLVGYVVVHHGADVTSDALRKHVGEVLPDAMVPSVVMRLDAFPLTPNGKIDRKVLSVDTSFASGDAQRSGAPPADDTEQLVADIWSSELDRVVGRDDNFFDVGGHSLLAVKVFRRLTEATSTPLALTDVFRFPTVRAFAAHLGGLKGARDGAATSAAPAVVAPTGADRGAMRRRALARRGPDQVATPENAEQ